MIVSSKLHDEVYRFFPASYMSLLPDSGRLQRSTRRSLRWQFTSFLLGAALLIIISAARDWPAPVKSVDVEQTRIDVALPPLPAGQPFVQSFRPAHDGLVEIELLPVRLAEGSEGSVTLRLHDDAGRPVAARSWPASDLEHNAPLTLRFPAQPGSDGQHYTLSLEGSQEFPFSFWGYDMDVYEGGALRAPGGTVRDLRFITRYQLLPFSAIQSVVGDLHRSGGELLLLLALVLMPGALLLILAKPQWPGREGATWWAASLALGLAVWPLLWYWLTLAGGRWRGWSLAAVLIAGWLAVFALWARKRPRLPRKVTLAQICLLSLLGLGLAVRLLAVRDLSFPPWVDPTRHALITQVMAAEGQIVRDYEPFLPVERFPYHFGFHTLPAGLLLLKSTPLPDLLLKMGQLLNALVALVVYAAAWLVTGRRGAALLAAFLVALPFFFPAYYASWGRFTQLSGVLLLPMLLALTWLAMEDRTPANRSWWLVGILAAGLALIHFRVFLLYLPFAVMAWLVAGRGQGFRTLAASALLALILAGPRLWELLQMASAAGTGILAGAPSSYNDFPWAYVTVGRERAFLAAAGVALLMAIGPALRGRSWARLALTLAAWSSIVLLLVSYTPTTWLINLNSAYITFFIPLALILGMAGGAVEAWWRRQGLWAVPAYALLGATLAALLLSGSRRQIDILNPVTQLARPSDLAGIAWVQENVPPEATVAVNSWQWLGATWAGSDGGAWLAPLTGHRTTTPPPDYVYDREMIRRVAAFNDAAQAVEDWSKPGAARWLWEEGVTHIFIGKRGGYFDPSELGRNPSLALRYSHDGVFVFEIDDIAAGSH